MRPTGDWHAGWRVRLTEARSPARANGKLIAPAARGSWMRPSVYIETSVVSYLAARPSRDVVVAAYQEITREWWRDSSDRFELVASALVVEEARAGDPDAARGRLEALEGVALLDATPDAENLAQALLATGAVPPQAADDAAHIAIAAANGVGFLVTWNFRHIANAAMRSRIDRACRQAGCEPPVICTPNELMETDDDERAE